MIVLISLIPLILELVEASRKGGAVEDLADELLEADEGTLRDA